jgi:hypothetical protein
VCALAAAVALSHSSSSEAAPVPRVLALADSELPFQAQKAIRRCADGDGVNPRSVVEVGGFGSGTAQPAALVGSTADGSASVSFFQGFGLTCFQAPAQLFRGGDPVALNEGFVGPQRQPTQVGVVGAAKESVDHVTIELGDGDVIEAPLVSTRGLRFFAYAGESADRFPRLVRAYDAVGNLLLEHEIPNI